MEKVKCVVWDLDNTIWQGTLLEGDKVQILPEVKNVVEELDRRGILQSISSKNDFNAAKGKLEELGIWNYFIYPRINWNPKSLSISKIASLINIGIDTLAFVDDQKFELDEVCFTYPEVLCIDASNITMMLEMEQLKPKFITDDSKLRRLLYQNDIKRNIQEDNFIGVKEEFLRTLNMVMKIKHAEEEDLKRVEELTVRTHQLNSTGFIYSYEELKGFIKDPLYDLLIVQLDDIYGTYGKIGLALIEKHDDLWVLKLLLMSCRVMSKGIGNVVLNFISNMAKDMNVSLVAQFVPTKKNRIMYISYKFNGFEEISKSDSVIIFKADLSYKRTIQDYIEINYEGDNIGF